MAILALALAIRVWGTWFGQPYALHPDEKFIVQKALDMLKGPAYDLNPHFFEYPSLYIYITAFSYLLLGLMLQACGSIAQWSQLGEYAAQNVFYFHLLGRLVSAILGAATVYLVYLAARRLWGKTTALLAAWFLTFAFVHFTDSHFLATDVPSAFCVMLAFHLCTLALQSEKWRAFYWAGFVSGLAASTKYPAGLILLTVLATFAMQQRAAGAALRQIFFSGAIVRISLCAAGGFLLGTPYAVLDFKSFAGGLLLQVFHSTSGHLGVVESGFFGYFTSITPNGGVGMVLMVAMFAGILCSLFKPRARDGLLLSFPFFFYLLIGNSALKVDRYLIPVIPFWCIHAGIFVARISAWCARRQWPVRFVAPMLALLLSAPSIYYAAKWCWIAVQPDTRLQAAAWMESNIPKGTIIATQAGSWMMPPVSPDRFGIVQIDVFMEESTRQQLEMKLALLDNPVSSWILRHGLDYQPAAAKVDSIRTALEHVPDLAMWRAAPLAHYQKQNTHFVITSSLLQRRFFDAATVAKYPEMARSWQAFYNELEARGKLVKEFVPPAAHEHNWGMGFLERPIIRVYSVHGS
ncbi:MAG: ArnT family glycosyltransferase [bacterium]